MSSPVISPLQCIMALVVFVGWTLSSFLCHQCGKLFMDRLVQSAGGDDMGLYQFIAALVLTGMQCSACIVTFNIRTGKEKNYRLILLGSHTLATMAVNYSMAYTEAASTLTIKLTEPVFMCVADIIVFKKRPSVHTVIAIPIIILGSLMFCGLSAANNSVLAGVVLAFVSNIVLTARNVTLKKLQGTESTESTVSLRESKAKYLWCPLLLSVMAVCYSLQYKWTSIDLTLICGVLLASCLFHVMYSYISTSLVLKVMDVVSHSIANIFKRLLVVVMLYGLGKRQATPWNFLGLCVTVAGLCLYVYDRHQTSTQHSGVMTSDKKRKYRAITVTVFIVSCIVGGSTLMIHYNKGVPGMTNIKEKINAQENVYLSTQTRMNENVADLPPINYFENPFRTNLLGKTLTQTHQIIGEQQRILINLLSNIIGKAPYVMLMDIPRHENKGDSAITVGEVMIIKKLQKRIVFYCETHMCAQDRYLQRAVNISKTYPVNDIVILLHGGGNLVGYYKFDLLREQILNTFPEHKIVLLSQSIWLYKNYKSHLEFCRQVYSNRTNLSMFIRDKQSLAIAKENFKGVKMYLAPDMAFGIGHVPRMLPPYFDIVWLRRKDNESPNYELPPLPISGISIHVLDWRGEWPSNKGLTDLDNAFNIAQTGFNFLQRGRIVITDRLHGHIMSVLMDIPHVLIDNPPFYKLSSFDQTWTEGLENTVLVTNGSNALQEALLLLAKYNHTLPEIGPSDMYVNDIEISSFN